MHYNPERSSLDAMLCMSEFVCDEDGASILESKEDALNHIDDLSRRIKDENHADKEERRRMRLSIRATQRVLK